eukprot:954921-Ditylum_brightwellii.AAC.1
MMLDSTPGALAISRDMFLNMPLIADWKATTTCGKQHVNDNLCCVNKKQHQYDYASGQNVLKKNYIPVLPSVSTLEE